MKWGVALASAILAVTCSAKDISECSCGFIDNQYNQVWTEALIVYFNETSQIPNEFETLDFTHKREYGYNSLYRQGATLQNAVINDQALQLWIDPSTSNHLVKGSGIEAKRQDMHFGTFRSSMRGPPKYSGGSAMSMMLYYNRTSFIELDMCDMERPDWAKFLTLKDGEFPDPKYQLNYTIFADNATVGGDPWTFVETKIDWTEKHVNWTIGGNLTRSVQRSRIDLSEPLPLMFKHWSIGDKYWMAGPPSERNQADVAWVRAFFNSSLTTLAQQQAFDGRCTVADMCSVEDITLRGSTSYPQAALQRYHEPPGSKSWRVAAGITAGAFFAFGCLTLINVLFRRAPWKLLLKRNRGVKVHIEPELSSPSPFVQGLLRGSVNEKPGIPLATNKKTSAAGFSTYSVEQKDQPMDFTRRRSVKFLNPFEMESEGPVVKDNDVAFTSAVRMRNLSTAQPTDWRKKSMAYHGALPDVVPVDSDLAKKTRKASIAFADQPGPSRPRQASLFQSIRASTQHMQYRKSMNADMVKQGFEQKEDMMVDPDTLQEIDLSHQTESNRRSTIARGRQPSVLERYQDNHFASIGGASSRPSRTSISIRDWNTQSLGDIHTIDPPHESQVKQDRRITLAEAVPVAAVDMPIAKAKEHEARINYLAGLVAFSSLGVTVIHFMLTFNPYAGGLNYGQHYRSEYWARWTVTPAILNPIWLGPFFVTSCRFLCARYLRDGDLGMIAEKMLLRAPRLLIPCFIIAAIEYLFFELDFMSWLQWLPSITWSEWAFISNYDNFGHYLNAMIELAYLIPNAAPQVVSHYCVGVLWSIPVQLQYSFTTLLAVVMIRDVKTPWKRFGFYAFCVITHWYSLSWGSCFWAGLTLADLQVTYKASARIQARPLLCWAFCIVMWIFVLFSVAMTLLQDRLNIPTLSDERNIHPDIYTGQKLGKTTSGGYPLYFEPRYNTLVFSVAMQLLVETSTWFQAFLSLKVWQPIFPHAFTIYLIHGFIWWTLGSYMVVQIGSRGTPYWATLLSTAIVCYFTLALTVIALSFLTETVTSALCRNIARWAMEPIVPKQPTLEPFPRNLFLDRNNGVPKDEEAEAGFRRNTIVNDAERVSVAEGGQPQQRRATVAAHVILEEDESEEPLDPMDPKASPTSSYRHSSSAGTSSSSSNR